MNDDLVMRLRARHANEYQTADLDALEAADRIEALEKKIEGLASDVETYRREAFNNIDALEVANRRIVVLSEALEEIAKFATRKSIGMMVHRLQGDGE